MFGAAALFRREVAGWMEDNMRGGEHLRWSASWSTRENEEEYRFRRDLANKLGQKGWLFPMFPKAYGGADLTIDHQIVLETELIKYGLNLSHVPKVFIETGNMRNTTDAARLGDPSFRQAAAESIAAALAEFLRGE